VNADPSRIWHLSHLQQMMGSDATEAETVALREVLVERGLLAWSSDRDGGSLIATDLEFSEAVSEVLRS
jgi:hypothetical protein